MCGTYFCDFLRRYWFGRHFPVWLLCLWKHDNLIEQSSDGENNGIWAIFIVSTDRLLSFKCFDNGFFLCVFPVISSNLSIFVTRNVEVILHWLFLCRIKENYLLFLWVLIYVDRLLQLCLLFPCLFFPWLCRFFFLTTASLGCNSQTVKFTHLKYRVQSFSYIHRIVFADFWQYIFLSSFYCVAHTPSYYHSFNEFSYYL